jgi:hypothetical protein
MLDVKNFFFNTKKSIYLRRSNMQGQATGRHSKGTIKKWEENYTNWSKYGAMAYYIKNR